MGAEVLRRERARRRHIHATGERRRRDGAVVARERDRAVASFVYREVDDLRAELAVVKTFD